MCTVNNCVSAFIPVVNSYNWYRWSITGFSVIDVNQLCPPDWAGLKEADRYGCTHEG